MAADRLAPASPDEGGRGLEQALDTLGYAAFIPRGTSMLPLLRSGRDSVLIRAQKNYRPYDIVLYRRENGEFVLHRIMGQDSSGFLMCGDRQWQMERGVAREQILGKAMEWTRNGKIRIPAGFCYNMYLFFWCRLFFLRRAAAALWHCIKRVYRRKTGTKNG